MSEADLKILFVHLGTRSAQRQDSIEPVRYGVSPRDLHPAKQKPILGPLADEIALPPRLRVDVVAEGLTHPAISLVVWGDCSAVSSRAQTFRRHREVRPESVPLLRQAGQSKPTRF